jgi:glucosamine 6-phosphate synthetase-like amidotransferase/phosphosugar isomerase protein
MAAIIEGKLEVAKYTGAASQWLEQNSKEVKKWAASDVLLGHTRLPTTGAVTKNNTHPFQIGSWVAAHNGCISNSAELMTQAKYVAKGETDSEEALCYIVGNDFSKESLAEIDGYFAFEALKKDGSEAVLAVDDRASLYIVQLGAGLIWCTSGSALDSSLAAVGIQADSQKLESKILRLPAMDVQELAAKRAAYWSQMTEASLGRHEKAESYTAEGLFPEDRLD